MCYEIGYAVPSTFYENATGDAGIAAPSNAACTACTGTVLGTTYWNNPGNAG